MSSRTAVDLAHLDRYTGGDASLNDEILALFHGQCHETLARLEAIVEGLDGESTAHSLGTDGKERWHKIVHTLKGGARGIGAFELADTAEAVERTDPSDRLAGLKALERIKQSSALVLSFIDEFRRRAP